MASRLAGRVRRLARAMDAGNAGYPTFVIIWMHDYEALKDTYGDVVDRIIDGLEQEGHERGWYGDWKCVQISFCNRLDAYDVNGIPWLDGPRLVNTSAPIRSDGCHYIPSACATWSAHGRYVKIYGVSLSAV